MQRQSPPKHRHDGTSPLPLGMDWSPPPRKWSGQDTVWPHDPRTGWSYCVTIPSWVVLPKSRYSDPVVFYRVVVGIQSPEGVTTTRAVLRRFNDFLKLFAALKRAFPRKNLPPAPPKGLMRMKSRDLLEERRCSLEEWMSKLLSDIDLSRSVAVASFLELEAAARSSFQDKNQHVAEANPSVNGTISSLQVHSNSNISALAGSSSLTPDYGSDTAYETSEVGTPSLGRDNNSEVGMEDLSLDEDLTSPIEKLVKYGMSNIDEGLFMGQAILEQLDVFPSQKVNGREINSVVENYANNGNVSKAAYLSGDTMEILSEPEHSKVIRHARKLSTESIGSDLSSQRGSENSAFPNSFADGPLDIPRSADISRTTEMSSNLELQFPSDVRLILPLDQRQKMNRILLTMERRLLTAKTDMEDLISRLNQEIAVKDYLSTKVKDLEVELETTKQKSKETLQQAILVERERFTQMQWDMEELRRKSLEMELKLKSEKDENPDAESTNVFVAQEKDVLLQELHASNQQLENLLKRHQELETKSKADIKILVKEVKSLRSSQAELTQRLDQSLKEKSDAEKLFQKDKQSWEHAKIDRRKLLHEWETLCNRLQQCSSNLFSGEEDELIVNSSLSDALDLLTKSDSQINSLLAEAQLLAQNNGSTISAADTTNGIDGGMKTIDDPLRKLLTEIFIDNARLRKQVNSVIRYALKIDISSNKKDD